MRWTKSSPSTTEAAMRTSFPPRLSAAILEFRQTRFSTLSGTLGATGTESQRLTSPPTSSIARSRSRTSRSSLTRASRSLRELNWLHYCNALLNTTSFLIIIAVTMMSSPDMIGCTSDFAPTIPAFSAKDELAEPVLESMCHYYKRQCSWKRGSGYQRYAG